MAAPPLAARAWAGRSEGRPTCQVWKLTGVWAAGSWVRPFRACGCFRAVTSTQRWDVGRGQRLRTSCPRCFLSDPNARPLRLHTEPGPARGPAAARPGEGRCPRAPVALLTGGPPPPGAPPRDLRPCPPAGLCTLPGHLREQHPGVQGHSPITPAGDPALWSPHALLPWPLSGFPAFRSQTKGVPAWACLGRVPPWMNTDGRGRFK